MTYLACIFHAGEARTTPLSGTLSSPESVTADQRGNLPPSTNMQVFDPSKTTAKTIEQNTFQSTGNTMSKNQKAAVEATTVEPPTTEPAATDSTTVEPPATESMTAELATEAKTSVTPTAEPTTQRHMAESTTVKPITPTSVAFETTEGEGLCLMCQVVQPVLPAMIFHLSSVIM